MKKVILLGATGLVAATVSLSALAANPGAYLGVKGGWDKYSTDNYSSGGATFKAKTNTGMAWGLQTGFNFSQYFGLELGYNNYSKVKYDDQTGSTTGETKFQAWDLSLLAKGYLPLPDNWDLMGGIGYSYVKGEFTGLASSDISTNKPHWYRPKAVIGVDYRFDTNMTLGFSFSHIFGTGSLNKLATDGKGSDYLPNINELALTFDYSFA